MPPPKIEVHGMRDLRRALKEAEGRSPKEIQQANKQAAGIVAGVAGRRFIRGPHQGGGNVTPAAASVKAQATSGRGVVAFGGQRSPHAPVRNFGGEIPRRGKTGATTHIQGHEVVFSTIHSEREHVLREYDQALRRIARNL
jgi:hypothetical protein